jgi:hypothetical protein
MCPSSFKPQAGSEQPSSACATWKDLGRDMCPHLHLAFDAHVTHLQVIWGGFSLVGKPVCSPTDKVGSENDHTFLQVDRWLGTHLDVMQMENAFAFLDPSFNGLSAVVVFEPLGQVFGDRVIARVQQGTVLEFLSGVETSSRRSTDTDNA